MVQGGKKISEGVHALLSLPSSRSYAIEFIQIYRTLCFLRYQNGI